LHGIQTQDPISDFSSALPTGHIVSRTHQIFPDINDSETDKAPLTDVRQRFQKPTFKHKAFKRNKKENSIFWPTEHMENKSGDGFEANELRITYHVRAPRQKKRQPPRLPMSFAALHLSSGPLPEVSFNNTGSKLPLKCGDEDDDDALLAIEPFEKRTSPPSKPDTQRGRRQVSFRDTDDDIMAQLSSISAPRRSKTDSDEEEEVEIEGGEDDEDEDDDDLGGDGEPNPDYDQPSDAEDADEDDLSLSEMLPSRQPSHSKSALRHPVFASVSNNNNHDKEETRQVVEHQQDVTLDFRKPTAPGRIPDLPSA
jgi:hypothetical protein